MSAGARLTAGSVLYGVAFVPLTSSPFHMPALPTRLVSTVTLLALAIAAQRGSAQTRPFQSRRRQSQRPRRLS